MRSCGFAAQIGHGRLHKSGASEPFLFGAGKAIRTGAATPGTERSGRRYLRTGARIFPGCPPII